MNGAPSGSEGIETQSLYQKAEKIYPREVEGRFASLRNYCVVVLLGLYYITPWFNWGDRQMVLFDLPARKFYILGFTFWPQDFIFLTGLLILAALSLFFFTALAGRLWCGYACPQTVWTEAFLWMEKITEGPAVKRRKLDKAPWTLTKVRKKLAKHTLWIVFALWTGFTFVGFFTPIRELSVKLVELSLGPWEWFWVLFYSFATWGNAGFMREQVCKYMCPYARFQSAMFDRDTLIISYDPARGEPRGSRSRKSDPQALNLGDCIDCTLCVQVCPTGIDIREGLQYECIACGACCDVCDTVMERMNYPKGLIRYTTQNTVDHSQSRVVRPRVIIYAVLLALITGLWGFGVVSRSEVMADVMRDRNALYRLRPNNRVENSFLLRVMNRAEQDRTFQIEVEGIPGMELLSDSQVFIEAGGIKSLPATLIAPAANVSGGVAIQFSITGLDNSEVKTVEDARFFGPE